MWHAGLCGGGNKRPHASLEDAYGGGPCACSAFGLFAAVACRNALAQSGFPIRNIQVDVAPLRVDVGDPTASWVQKGVPDKLAQALAGRMTGGTLVVRIDYVALGPIKDRPEFWGEVQPPASLKGLDIPSRRTVFVPWKPSRRPAFGMGNPTFR
jgi:hypothetical protein